MKTMKTISAFVSLAMIPGIAGAAQDIGEVRRVFVFESSCGFQLKQGFPNAAAEHGCIHHGGFARIPSGASGNENNEAMYSAVLAALASGLEVQINTNGCIGGHFRVSGIYVRRAELF